jgi:hypothetical protein
MMRLTSALSLVTKAAGIPAGPDSENQVTDVNLEKPNSAKVGTWGKSLRRLLDVTANAFKRPAWMCTLAVDKVVKDAGICPATKSAMAGEAPL